MTPKLDVESLCTPVDLVGLPSVQYVKIDEVMDVCVRLGARLAANTPAWRETRSAVIEALRELGERGAPLERIMLYEIAHGMQDADGAPVGPAPLRAQQATRDDGAG